MTAIDLPILDQPSFRTQFNTELRAAEVISTLQINIGYICNLACRHCHVDSSPARTAEHENMSRATAERVVHWALRNPSIRTVDITGGSPEMNPNFRWMVRMLREAGKHVMDRCNPTIIASENPSTGESFNWIPQFLAANEVEVVASLPCYLEDNVDRQRGSGAFEASVEGLRRLNLAGYGVQRKLPLNLVFNPTGASLPPPEHELERDYKRELETRFGIVFNRLWALTNMPIRRWRRELDRQGRLEAYMTTLIDAFNVATLPGLMCRHQISIDPQGRLYDCDFNQALSMHTPGTNDRFLWDFTAADLALRSIATDDHCYGCTAGAGSSCGGALA